MSRWRGAGRPASLTGGYATRAAGTSREEPAFRTTRSSADHCDGSGRSRVEIHTHGQVIGSVPPGGAGVERVDPGYARLRVIVFDL